MRKRRASSAGSTASSMPPRTATRTGWRASCTGGRMMLAFVLLVVLLGWLFLRLPSSFLPEEDQGYVVSNIELPTGATANRTVDVLKQVEDYFMKIPAVENVIAIQGYSFNGNGLNAAIAFTTLGFQQAQGQRGFRGRHRLQCLPAAADGHPRRHGVHPGAAGHLRAGQRHRLRLPPAGSRRGRNRGAGRGHRPADGPGDAEPGAVAGPHHRPGTGHAAQPEHRPRQGGRAGRGLQRGCGIDLHRRRLGLPEQVPQPGPDAEHLGAGRRAVPHAAQGCAGAERPQPAGGMVPLSSFVTAEWKQGPVQVVRYNSYESIRIGGNAAPGYTTGDAMAEMERLGRSCRRATASSGTACPTRNARPATRPRS